MSLRLPFVESLPMDQEVMSLAVVAVLAVFVVAVVVAVLVVLSIASHMLVEGSF